MQEIQYRVLVGLTYQMAAIFSFGLPLVILFWSFLKKEASILRLLSIYWKVSSLIAISILLLIGNQPIGYLTSFASSLIIISSLWFWIDLNEELNEMPPWRALPLTVKTWRWSLSFTASLYGILTFITLPCFQLSQSENCISWLEGPQSLHQITKIIFNFLFGGNWTESLSGFIGYVALIAYIIGLIQWLLIRLPKQGRIAGDF